MLQKTKSNWWIIVVLLLLATSLSFLDRQVLSVSILKIKEDLSISDIEYGFINASFLVSYAVMFTLGGILIDRYGSRLGLAFSVGFWSLATLLHSISSTVFHFGLFRFLLGIGEGGCFPGAIKAVMEWVPRKKHALANGIAIGGSAIGAVVAPPLCVFMLGWVGWRAAFLISGCFGFLWLLAWLFYTRYNHRDEQPLELTHSSPKDYENKQIRLSVLLKNKEVWVFIIIRFLLDPIFYFYMFWIPKYLNEGLSLSLDLIGRILWIPFLALGLANIFGGWLSDIIFSKTSNINKARKQVMGFAALMTIPVISIGFIHSYFVVLILMSLAFFAHGLWITNYITSISDVFGKNITSTVVGLSGTAGALSSLVLNPVIGVIITHYSYNPLWWYAGTLYPLAFLFFLWFIPRIEYKDLSVQAG
jgi:ACS family hexuronate transporter-like MFS transporter